MIRAERERFCTGCPCADLAALNRQAALGCDPVANARVQATTGEVPAGRWRREAWLPLAGQPLEETSVVVPRRVSWEGRVAYEGHHDSVPSP